MRSLCCCIVILAFQQARPFYATWLTSCKGPTACSRWKAREISCKWLKSCFLFWLAEIRRTTPLSLITERSIVIQPIENLSESENWQVYCWWYTAGPEGRTLDIQNKVDIRDFVNKVRQRLLVVVRNYLLTDMCVIKVVMKSGCSC